MATSFPTSLDALSNPVSGDALSSPSHADQHANANDAIEAIEAAIGTTAAPVLAKLDSPTFTGTPAAPTAAVDTNTTQVATTAYVVGQGYAKLASPTFTGTPTLPTGTIATTQTAGDSSTKVATTAFVAAESVVASPIGMITAYAGSTAPSRWLLCFGQAISRTTYSSLFAVISTTYGVGDGSTTFNVPDLRGRTVAGLDNMGGTDAGRLSTANTLGTSTGTETVTLTSGESGVPAHSHANTLTNNAVTSGGHSADHSHGFQTGGRSADHSHGLNALAGNDQGYGFGHARAAGGTAFGLNYVTGGASADHSHSGTTIGASVNHTHSVTSNVTIGNVNNTAANAASAHNNMQPTMTINYIILAGA